MASSRRPRVLGPRNARGRCGVSAARDLAWNASALYFATSASLCELCGNALRLRARKTTPGIPFQRKKVFSKDGVIPKTARTLQRGEGSGAELICHAAPEFLCVPPCPLWLNAFAN